MLNNPTYTKMWDRDVVVKHLEMYQGLLNDD